MRTTKVFSLPSNELEPFLDRRRYSAFSLNRRQLGDFLGEVLAGANDFVPSMAGSILMDRPQDRGPTPEATALFFIAAFGKKSKDLLGLNMMANQGVVGHVYRTGEPYLMSDPENDPNFSAEIDRASSFSTRGVLAVPIRIEKAVCGVLELINRLEGDSFTDEDLKLLEIFARYTSVSIENLLDAQRASEMARRDDLTGLNNDRFFHHRLTEDLIRADLKESTVGLLFLDLDDFKKVNDNHGHLAGSQVLKEFGYLLHKTVDIPHATLARYGGDEFVIILPDLDVDGVLAVAENICSALSKTPFLQGNFSWAEGPVYWRSPLTASIGAAVYPLHMPRRGSTDLKKNLLLRAADQAMYAAKEEGKNAIKVAG